jgi:very-short-patch-repair endonuclease
MRTTRTPLTGVARKLRAEATDAERRLWYHLRNRQFAGCKFRRQFAIGNYVVDFACLERNLIIELDGGQHADRVSEDERRTRFLEGNGFAVLRFWNDEVLKETDAVLSAISSALGPSP